MKDSSTNWVLIIFVVIVVAVIASFATVSLTGNIIRTNHTAGGQYQVYTKYDIDQKLMNMTTNQKVLDMLEDRGSAYDIALSDDYMDSNSDGYISGEEVCNQEQGKRCLLVFSEFNNGGIAGSDPLGCTSKQPIDVNDTTPEVLNVWCVSP